MIPATSIELEKSTGYIHNCSEKLLTADDYGNEMWQKADELLRAWSWSVTGGSDDVDFVITFADSYRYRGTVEIQHPSKAETEKLSEHIKKHCRVYSGLECPYHMSDGEYRQFLTTFNDKGRSVLSRILETYQLG